MARLEDMVAAFREALVNFEPTAAEHNSGLTPNILARVEKLAEGQLVNG